MPIPISIVYFKNGRKTFLYLWFWFVVAPMKSGFFVELADIYNKTKQCNDARKQCEEFLPNRNLEQKIRHETGMRLWEESDGIRPTCNER